MLLPAASPRSIPALALYALTALTACANHVPRPTAPTQRAVHATHATDAPSAAPGHVPTPREFRAQRTVHRPLSSPPVARTPLDAPLDWRTLPQSAELWRVKDAWLAPVPVGDVFVLQSRDALTAMDMETGRRRWSVLVASRAGSARFEQGAYVIGACNDIVVGFLPEAILGIDAATGSTRWRIASIPRGDSSYTTPGFPIVDGCNVVFHRIRGTQMLAETEPCDAIELDARTGVTATIGHARVLDRGPGWQRLEPSEQHQDLATATRRIALPPQTWRVVDGASTNALAIVASGGALQGIRVSDGSVVWSTDVEQHVAASDGEARFDQSMNLASLGDDAIARTRHGIARIDLHTGAIRWRIPLGEDFRYARSEPHIVGQHVVLGVSGNPPFVLTLDAATGGVVSMLLSPIDPGDFAVSGTHLAIASRGEVVGIDTALEAPPQRDIYPLETEVTEALAVMLSPPPPIPATADPRVPVIRADGVARQMLQRLVPLVRPQVLQALRDVSMSKAAVLVPLLTGDEDPASEQLLLDLLRQTFVAPTPAAVQLRSACAETIRAPLPAAIANDLANATIAWIAPLRRLDRGATSGSVSADDLRAAIRASRDLLSAASPSSVPLLRLHAAIAGNAAALPCTPRGDDAIRAAVLLHEAELWPPSIPTRASMPGVRCGAVATLWGIVVPSSQREGQVIVSEPEPIRTPPHEDAAGLALWRDAPGRLVAFEAYGAGGTAEVRLIDGSWRWVDLRVRWIQ